MLAISSVSPVLVSRPHVILVIPAVRIALACYSFGSRCFDVPLAA